MSKEIAGRCAG